MRMNPGICQETAGKNIIMGANNQATYRVYGG